eukprot:SAG22_NODE_91_length_20952_cov_9.064307_2_plen_244_part_00
MYIPVILIRTIILSLTKPGVEPYDFCGHHMVPPWSCQLLTVWRRTLLLFYHVWWFAPSFSLEVAASPGFVPLPASPPFSSSWQPMLHLRQGRLRLLAAEPSSACRPRRSQRHKKWYRKAAKQGHSGGQYKLDNCYRTGKGVEKDDAEAVHRRPCPSSPRSRACSNRLPVPLLPRPEGGGAGALWWWTKLACTSMVRVNKLFEMYRSAPLGIRLRHRHTTETCRHRHTTETALRRTGSIFQQYM